MLESTFIHIPGIGESTEQELWRQGITCWDDFENKSALIHLPKNKIKLISKYISLSKARLQSGDHHFFSANLPTNQQWRAFPSFKPCYLDIETTGLDKHRNSITTIGIYDGKQSKVFIKGKNLDDFQEEINKFNAIVSFNGIMFDVPFIKAKYDINLDQLHIDLRFVLARLGYKGGLKKIEKDLGITRGNDIEGLDGYEAVRLWRRYQRGDEQALKTLVKYNIADIENLKILMEFSYDLAKKRCFDSNF